jgi:hypothetical protein
MAITTAYSILLGGSWAVSGLAYIISIIVKRKDSNLAAVVTILTMCLFCGQAPTLDEMRESSVTFGGMSASFGRYMYEAIWISEIERWPEVWCPDVKQYFDQYGLNNGNYIFCIQWLWILGFIFRAIAYYCLVATRATEQQRSRLEEFGCGGKITMASLPGAGVNLRDKFTPARVKGANAEEIEMPSMENPTRDSVSRASTASRASDVDRHSSVHAM